MASTALSSLSSPALHNAHSPRSSSLQGINLFSSLPTPNHLSPDKSPPQIKPPIPPPKYPPPRKKQPNPAFKLTHRNSKYYKPIKDKTVLASEGERSVVVGENGVSYLLPDAPFEFQYSYSETPRVKPLAIREPAFLPFGPPTMPRPWTGKAPLKKSKKKIPLFDPTHQKQNSHNSVVKHVGMPIQFGKYPKKKKSREEIIGEPLKKWEIKIMIKPYLSDNRQVNLGRDGLTHNMLELIHCHWKRQPICKVRCKGLPTVDMDNVCFHLEEKTGGKIIHQVGGVVYLFRGRNYDPKDRPQYPVMLWKPAAPVYPKLIKDIPEGLTRTQANEFREKGKSLLPICKLAKNGVYITLVNDVKAAFEGSPLVKIDCKGMHASDYKKLGAKLKELVPCVLLSFDDEQILMWRGQNWKSMYPETASLPFPAIANESENSGKSDDMADFILDAELLTSSRRMTSLWKHALESSKAILLDEIYLGPDDLLRKVEEFERISQTTEHTYPVLLLTSDDHEKGSVSEFKYNSNGENSDEEENDFPGNEYEDDDPYDSESFEEIAAANSAEKLPIDLITANVLKRKCKEA